MFVKNTCVHARSYRVCPVACSFSLNGIWMLVRVGDCVRRHVLLFLNALDLSGRLRGLHVVVLHVFYDLRVLYGLHVPYFRVLSLLLFGSVCLDEKWIVC